MAVKLKIPDGSENLLTPDTHTTWKEVTTSVGFMAGAHKILDGMETEPALTATLPADERKEWPELKAWQNLIAGCIRSTLDDTYQAIVTTWMLSMQKECGTLLMPTMSTKTLLCCTDLMTIHFWSDETPNQDPSQV